MSTSTIEPEQSIWHSSGPVSPPQPIEQITHPLSLAERARRIGINVWDYQTGDPESGDGPERNLLAAAGRLDTAMGQLSQRSVMPEIRAMYHFVASAGDGLADFRSDSRFERLFAALDNDALVNTTLRTGYISEAKRTWEWAKNVAKQESIDAQYSELWNICNLAGVKPSQIGISNKEIRTVLREGYTATAGKALQEARLEAAKGDVSGSIAVFETYSRKAGRSIGGFGTNRRELQTLAITGHTNQALREISRARELSVADKKNNADVCVGRVLEQCKKGGLRLEQVGSNVAEILSITSDAFKVTTIGKQLALGSYEIVEPKSGQSQIVLDKAIWAAQARVKTK